jgi:hypothetical protein
MDLSPVSASLASISSPLSPQAVASVAMQKKAMEIQQQTAAQLIAAIAPSAPKASAGDRVGSLIDVTA